MYYVSALLYFRNWPGVDGFYFVFSTTGFNKVTIIYNLKAKGRISKLGYLDFSRRNNSITNYIYTRTRMQQRVCLILT